MTNPYQIESPALISFSGGRTSGLHAAGRSSTPTAAGCRRTWWPASPTPARRCRETLDFVRECGGRWNVHIVWLEYAPDGEKQRKFRVVDHATRQPQGRTLRGPAARAEVPAQPGDQVLHYDTQDPRHARLRPLAGLGALDQRRRPAVRRGPPGRQDQGSAGTLGDDSPALRRRRDQGGRRGILGRRSPSTSACRTSTARRRPGIATLLPQVRQDDLGHSCASDPSLADWWIRMEEEAGRPSRSAAFFRKDRPNYRRMRDAVLAEQGHGFRGAGRPGRMLLP